MLPNFTLVLWHVYVFISSRSLSAAYDLDKGCWHLVIDVQFVYPKEIP